MVLRQLKPVIERIDAPLHRDLIQEGFAYIAPPFAVIFTLGLLWRRANVPGAMATIVLGFGFTLFLQFYLFRAVAWMTTVAPGTTAKPGVTSTRTTGTCA